MILKKKNFEQNNEIVNTREEFLTKMMNLEQQRQIFKKMHTFVSKKG